MKKRKFGFGLNRGVFCGKIATKPEFDHNIENENGEVVRKIYKIEVDVVFENRRKTVRDESTLPFLVAEDILEEVGELAVGDLVFIKGRWRAFSRKEGEKSRTIPIGTISKIEKVDELTRTQNKIELHGYLKSKIYKVEFDEEGNIKRDENGRPIPVLDEEGNRIPWTRRNHEKLQVNDVIVLVKNERILEDGTTELFHQDFIPAIGYSSVARQIQNDIEIDQKVKARGYVRQREKNGYPGEYVYEVVITRITALDEDGNAIETKNYGIKPEDRSAKESEE